jgi:hypothetical protein
VASRRPCTTAGGAACSRGPSRSCASFEIPAGALPYRPGRSRGHFSLAPVSCPMLKLLVTSRERLQVGQRPSGLSRRNGRASLRWGFSLLRSETERRRSRTDPAWGCQTSPVLKVCHVRCVWRREQTFGTALVRRGAVKSAENGTRCGTNSGRVPPLPRGRPRLPRMLRRRSAQRTGPQPRYAC